jgi:acyl-CoA hydrolase
MNTWKERYKELHKPLDEAIRSLPKRATVIMSMAAMEGQGFMGRVHKHSDHFEHLTIVSCLNMKSYQFCENPEYQGTFMNQNWFYGPSNRKAAAAGYRLVEYLPNNLHQAGGQRIKQLRETGDTIVFWGTTLPLDEKTGYFNLGLSNVYEMEVALQADMVVCEVNDQVPYMEGDHQLHIRNVDMIVEFSAELPEIPLLDPSALEIDIAGHIAPLVPDRATLQIGIGGIPNAVAKLMHEKKDLGIHTEMFTESMIDLFEQGVVTNMYKSIWKGKTICTFALGSRAMYTWVERNPGILLLRGSYVNDPAVIARNTNMISINTAITVDLTGQVCSESIGPVQYSGTGGQLDTHRGAVKSPGGKGIIALRSTARKGTLSTIVPLLPIGSAVTVPRQDIDWVVTEYGAVHLQGRSVSERARLLIGISHPDFRDELKSEAKKLGYL